ncbi:MAG: hypothetical protein LBS51_03910 [Oscillospiraceae bacterium]|jgi:hypothetical protein|nr:hypothetical protein [Oscillospiraceae bacterium]
MATYKVSYKMLAKQGEELKAAAKLVDGYAERVTQVRGKLGEDQMLAEVRSNLSKLQTQLGESRVILNTAGELLTKTVGTYTTTETRQVKKVDSLKAHNRDFYKNPVVVASAGGATAAAATGAGTGAGAGAGAATAGAATSAGADTPVATTVNYTETNTVNYTQATVVTDSSVSSPIPDGQSAPSPVNTAAAVSTPAAAAKAGAGNVAGMAAGVGAAGGVLGVGGVLGAKKLADNAKKNKKQQPDAVGKSEAGPPGVQKPDTPGKSDDYDPEAELAAALERVRRLEEEGQ